MLGKLCSRSLFMNRLTNLIIHEHSFKILYLVHHFKYNKVLHGPLDILRVTCYNVYIEDITQEDYTKGRSFNAISNMSWGFCTF